MARVHHRKAAKDYPQFGIAKGDMHYYVKIKTGPRSSREMRSKTPFKRSQLTSSDYQSQLYDWEDSKAEISDMESAQEFADTIRSLGEEQREKLDNMPEGLQQGSTGEMLTERAAACEAAAGEIEEAITDWKSAKDTWESEIETYKEELAAHKASQEEFDAWESAQDDLDEGEEGDPEPTVEAAPDLPYNTQYNGNGAFEFDKSEWLDHVREVSVG